MIMFLCDKTVTVVNQVTDGVTDETRLFCRTFSGCGWYTDHAVTGSGTARNSEVSTKARLPVENCPGFTHVRDWRGLTDAQRAECWTLDPQTVLLLGAYSPTSAAELADARRQTESVQVARWADHRGTCFPHLFVAG